MTCESLRTQSLEDRKTASARFDAALILGLGSNLGDSRTVLRWAVDQLGNLYGTLEVAPVYRTTPVSAVVQADYLNTVVVAPDAIRDGSAASPDRVLDQIQDLERQAGRLPNNVPDSPRILDIDLLLFGRHHVDSGDGHLRVPHPRMCQRRFVLQPLCDLDPDLTIPPSSTRVADLLAAISTHQRVEPVPNS